MHRRETKYIHVLERKTNGERPFATSIHKWKDSTEMQYKVTGWQDMGLIHLVQNRVRCRAFVNTVMNVGLP